MSEVVEPPTGLDAGGRALWQAATVVKVMHPGELVVLEEACRIKDRLDRLHALLVGDRVEWARVRDFESDRDSAVMVDQLVTEARLHAGELRQLVEKLRLSPADSDGQGKEAAKDDPLAAARAAREARLRGAGAAG